MNNLKRCLAVLMIVIVVALTMAGCASQDSSAARENATVTPPTSDNMAETIAANSVASGAYVETPVRFEETGNIVGIAQGGGKVIAAMQTQDSGVVRFYQIDDMETVELNCAFTMDAQSQFLKLCVDQDDRLTLLVQQASAAPKSMVFSVYQQEGDAFAKRFDYDSASDSIAAMDGDQFIVSREDGIAILDARGNVVDYPRVSGYNFIENGGVLFALAFDGQTNSVTRYSYQEKASLGGVTLTDVSYVDDSNLCADSAGGFYVVGREGIMHVASGGSKVETLVDDISMAFAYPENNVIGVASNSAGQLYALIAGNAGQTALYRYAWSDSAVKYEKTTISIVSISENYMIRRAIADFVRANPNVRVNYRAYLDISYANSVSFNTLDELREKRTQFDDVLRNINTEILSGNGPDLLILDGLNIANLAGKGILDDMSGWAQPYLDDGTLLKGPVEGFRREDGTLPCVALTYTVPVIWADAKLADALDSLDDLVAAAESPAGQHLFDLSGERELLLTFYPIFAASWSGADGRVAFTKEQLSGFLQKLKRIQEAVPRPDTSEGNNAGAINMLGGRADAAMSELDVAQLGAYWYTLMKNSGKDPSLAWLPAVAGIRAYRPSTIIGVGATSEHKDAAYALLDMIIANAEEEQPGPDDIGYSIVANRAKRQLAYSAATDSDFAIGQYGGRDIKLESVDERTLEEMYEVLSGVNTPVFTDYTLITMMLETCEPYLSGGESLENAVDKFYGYIKAEARIGIHREPSPVESNPC